MPTSRAVPRVRVSLHEEPDRGLGGILRDNLVSLQLQLEHVKALNEVNC